MNSIVIVGSGGHGRVLAQLASLNEFVDISFIDRSYSSCLHTEIDGIPLIGGDSDFECCSKASEYIVGIGDNGIRKAKFLALVQSQLVIGTLIHPGSSISTRVTIGMGSAILNGAILVNDTTVKSNCIVNTGAIIDHNCIISAHTHIAPGAILAGGVQVGESSLIGIGARVLPYVKIGNNVTVGAGAVVTQDVPDGATVVGIPARPLNYQ